MFPNIITNTEHYPLISPDFSAILFPFFSYKSTHNHIWRCTLAAESIPQHCHQQWATSKPIIASSKPPQAHYHKQQAHNSADCHKFSWGKKSMWPCSGSKRMWPGHQEHNHVTMLPRAWSCDQATRSMIMWPCCWACEQASGDLTMTQTTQPLVATHLFLWPSPMVLK